VALIAAASHGAAPTAPAGAAEVPCDLTPRTACFGVASTSVSLSSHQAGAHPDMTIEFDLNQDPESEVNPFGEKDAYAATRNVRVELPPGMLGDPNAIGAAQQCTVAQLVSFACPNGSQVGRTEIRAYGVNSSIVEPLYMMVPPGGEVAARLGTGARVYPTFIDFKLRSESDYGLTAEFSEAIAAARLIGAETTAWGVPAAPVHDTERCGLSEALFEGCTVSPARPPGGRELPFLTNPTRCSQALGLHVGAASWSEPDRFDAKEVPFPTITGCDKLPFGPGLEIEPTSHRAATPTGAEVTIKLAASEGVEVLEPSQMRSIRVKLPEGFAINPASGDGLGTCSPLQARIGRREASACPDQAKLAETEFDIPVLERELRGAVYLREPEPGHPYRIWVLADGLGLHVKLPGELHVDQQSGQIESIVVDPAAETEGMLSTGGIPQAPLREAKIEFKSGFRAPLVTPSKCGTFQTEYEFIPWSGGPPKRGTTPMTISEGCDTGGFDPDLQAGSTNPQAGQHTPFVFTLTREDGEQNPTSLQLTLPEGMSATFAGVARCEGADAASGQCPAASRLGRVNVAVGAGPFPLWVPQAGKRPTAVYLGGPYKGAPLSIIAVVPKQAGPFDFGDEVVRSAVYVDPVSAEATIKSDPLPQLIEGVPIGYRTLHVIADREGFTLNPTGCKAKEVAATLTSASGALAHPSSPFLAANCANLSFKPRLSLKLKGGAKRGSHPAFTATFRPREGDANAKAIVVRLPSSAFLDQAHIRTICTRVQFAAGEGNGAQCPPGSRYGKVSARTPLLDFPLEGEVFLRSSNHNLPDMVLTLHGPPSMPIEIEAVGRIDSVRGGIRSSFEAIPDAPLTKVTLQMQGGNKGLIVNSRNLCAGKPSRAEVKFGGHNGRRATLRPVVKAGCKKGRKRR
jgi:hypothetical protein